MLWQKNTQWTSQHICVLKYLAELDLQGNVLTKLPESVGEMEHLTSINLANNSFSVFPDKLTEIASLERINLEGNSITGNTIFKLISLFSYSSIWVLVYSVPLILSHRNSTGEVVRHASTEVAKFEVKPFGLQHSGCSTITPEIWNCVCHCILKDAITIFHHV